ncbi:unnamed protein product, partial [Linum tenue]
MASTFSGDETAPFFGFLRVASALVFSCMGAAYGTVKSGVGVASMGVMRPELVMKSIVPVVMAGFEQEVSSMKQKWVESTDPMNPCISLNARIAWRVNPAGLVEEGRRERDSVELEAGFHGVE